MCGICGFISKENIGTNHLQAMRDAMINRGPDDAGQDIIFCKNYYVGLAHRRLSIIDLSSNGRQPMHSKDGSISIVFNGEIYNYKELRQELNCYSYNTETDTEVLLAAYQKWGVHFVDHCNGMFAIALLDHNKGILYLIRDRMGQKPLYYYKKGNLIIFASELKAIMKYPGLTFEINREILGRYLVKQCIAGPDTIFKNTYKLIPGEIVAIKGFSIQKKRYWDVNKSYIQMKKQFKGSYRQAMAAVSAAMTNSIRYRLCADVPVGVLLSGGYDSSLIACWAQKQRVDKIKTYSVGIEHSSLDETKYAREIAEFIGTDHHELYISQEEMLRMIKEIPQYYDEPFADSSQIATMIVSKFARQDVTVVLSGDGGDELFAGYPIYEKERFAQKLDGIGKLLYIFKNNSLTSAIYKKLPFAVRMIAENTDVNTKTQFNYYAKEETAKKILGECFGNENYNESAIPAKRWNIRRMLLDMQTYLPDDLFCKVDRASMMFSLEARSPFMDIGVIELALSLPHKFKQKGNMGKRVLKDIAWEIFPKELLDRPKAGFEVPIDDWLKNDLKAQLLKYSRKNYLEKQGIFDPAETEKIVDNYLNSETNKKQGQKITSVIWSFFVFQMWYRYYIENEVIQLAAL